MVDSYSTNDSLVRSSIFDSVENEMEENSIKNSPSCKKSLMWTKIVKKEELL